MFAKPYSAGFRKPQQFSLTIIADLARARPCGSVTSDKLKRVKRGEPREPVVGRVPIATCQRSPTLDVSAS